MLVQVRYVAFIGLQNGLFLKGMHVYRVLGNFADHSGLYVVRGIEQGVVRSGFIHRRIDSGYGHYDDGSGRCRHDDLLHGRHNALDG